MFHKTLIGLFIWIGGHVGFAQHSATIIDLHLDCGATYQKRTPQKGEAELQRSRSANIAIPEDSLLSLPVIVHIVHQGEGVGQGSNLSFARILSQFEVLNKDFRQLSLGQGGESTSSGGDSFIEFIPAELRPDGQPLEELGVHRMDAREEGWNAPPYNDLYVESTIKPQSQWNPKEYLNVWVLELEGGLRGLAQFPDDSGLNLLAPDQGAPETDGIVVDVDRWGESSLGFGRIPTHEMGHFLGLIHTWGEGGCDSDDGCEDTPTSAAPLSGCPQEPFSCGNAVMKENFMDLSGGQCQNTFTRCQILRMRQTLSRSPRRWDLLSSPVARAPKSAPLASFSSIEFGASCSGSLQFTDESLHQPFFWSWDFGNGETSDLPNPLVNFEEEGVYTVSLTVRNFRGSHSIQVEVPVCLSNSSSNPLAGLLSLEAPQINPSTQTISVAAQIERPATLQVSLFNIQGKKISQLIQGDQQAGIQEIEFSYQHIAPGIYLLIWEVAGVSVPQKVFIR